MNKLILVSFLFVCVGYAIAGYGSGTPGYYDPWTYYGGYERYYYNRYGRNPQRYYPISRYNSGSSYSRSQPQPYDTSNARRYNSPMPYGRSSSSPQFTRSSYYMDDDYQMYR